MDKKLFEAWTFAGVKFCAVRDGVADQVHVVDEVGNNYGSWMTTDRFRSLQAKGDQMATPLGRVVGLLVQTPRTY